MKLPGPTVEEAAEAVRAASYMIEVQQACEQMAEAAKDFAPLLGNYFHTLLARGFKRKEALVLARDWQKLLWQQSRSVLDETR